MVKRWRVRRTVRKAYWEGFFDGLTKIREDGMPLSWTNVPRWYNPVWKLAHKAGADYAAAVLDRLTSPDEATRRWGHPRVSRQVPEELYGRAYIEAACKPRLTLRVETR